MNVVLAAPRVTRGTSLRSGSTAPIRTSNSYTLTSRAMASGSRASTLGRWSCRKIRDRLPLSDAAMSARSSRLAMPRASMRALSHAVLCSGVAYTPLLSVLPPRQPTSGGGGGGK